MDEESLRETADMLSNYSYKIDALVNTLMEKKVFSKDEFNNKLNEVMEKAKEEPRADEYVIEEMKEKVFLK